MPSPSHPEPKMAADNPMLDIAAELATFLINPEDHRTTRITLTFDATRDDNGITLSTIDLTSKPKGKSDGR